MESQLDGSDTRSDTSSHTFVIMIRNIAIYDFVLRVGGSSAKAEKKLVLISFTDGSE